MTDNVCDKAEWKIACRESYVDDQEGHRLFSITIYLPESRKRDSFIIYIMSASGSVGDATFEIGHDDVHTRMYDYVNFESLDPAGQQLMRYVLDQDKDYFRPTVTSFEEVVAFVKTMAADFKTMPELTTEVLMQAKERYYATDQRNRDDLARIRAENKTPSRVDLLIEQADEFVEVCMNKLYTIVYEAAGSDQPLLK